MFNANDPQTSIRSILSQVFPSLPRLHDGIMVGADWIKLIRVAPFMDRILLYGPPDTGKSTTAVSLLKAYQDRPVYRTVLTEESPADAIKGYERIDRGSMIYVDGIASRALTEGAILLLDEINRASGDMVGFLYSIAERPETAYYSRPDGSVVRPAPGYSLVATMNERPETSGLPDAILSRFTCTIAIDTPSPWGIAALPTDLQTVAQGVGSSADPEARRGLRSFATFATLRENTDLDLAAEIAFGSAGSAILDAIRVADTV